MQNPLLEQYRRDAGALRRRIEWQARRERSAAMLATLRRLFSPAARDSERALPGRVSVA